MGAVPSATEVRGKASRPGSSPPQLLASRARPISSQPSIASAAPSAPNDGASSASSVMFAVIETVDWTTTSEVLPRARSAVPSTVFTPTTTTVAARIVTGVTAAS